MSTDPTLSQGDPERLRAQEMSLRQCRPPAAVPGYDLERFLGSGAYGEVWVAIERNTGRRVAIKFYLHRGGLDWSLLSREVEKLAFLFADRYVVQLIGVGWDSDPPYYIMEYVEQGSLAERLQYGTLPVGEAVNLFREVAVGLVHAHGKGVLHCDLKPANILLDQDGKPRLADFGQSRLSHEQIPALGTLFYMAPEQADLKAQPDARWDVYALGALLYCMLTGEPPYRDDALAQQLERTADLEQRLAIYRRAIRKAPPAQKHRQTPGVDRALVEIIDRSIAASPERRYPNVQAVLDALELRAARRARRPTMILGAVGPLLLLLIVSLFSWQGFSAAVQQHAQELAQRARANNQLNALRVADIAAKELQRRFEAVEQVAGSPEFQRAAAAAIDNPELVQLSGQLSDPKYAEPVGPVAAEQESLLKRFQSLPARQSLQAEFRRLIPPWMSPPAKEGEEGEDQVASWFFCDADGVSTVRAPESPTIGKNFAWRSFFHNGERDHERSWRPDPKEHLRQTRLSAVFQSQANGNWIVAASAPVLDREHGNRFLGVVALTVRVNRFVELKGDENQFGVLVDLRPGDHHGLILQHPLYDQLRPIRPADRDPASLDAYRKQQVEYRETLKRLQDYRLPAELEPDESGRAGPFEDYRDPLAAAPEGRDYDRHWLACMEPVVVRGEPTHWVVLVQESYDSAIGAALNRLRHGLLGYGLAALAMVALVLASLWLLALRLLNEHAPARPALSAGPTEGSSVHRTPRSSSQTHVPPP